LPVCGSVSEAPVGLVRMHRVRLGPLDERRSQSWSSHRRGPYGCPERTNCQVAPKLDLFVPCAPVRSLDHPLKIPLMAMVSPPVANQQDYYCNAPCHVSSCPVQPKTRSCANKKQDLPEYRTNWPRVGIIRPAFLLPAAFIALVTGQSATAQPTPAVRRAPCVAF
jgi:hypothetical protein